MVQSICLTSRGSGVRIPQLPPRLSYCAFVDIFFLVKAPEVFYDLQVKNIGSLAQLVQSICLTSRGSGVRIPQLPHEVFQRNFDFSVSRHSASEHSDLHRKGRGFESLNSHGKHFINTFFIYGLPFLHIVLRNQKSFLRGCYL